MFSKTNSINGLFDRYAVVRIYPRIEDYTTHISGKVMIDSDDGRLFIRLSYGCEYLNNENFDRDSYIEINLKSLKKYRADGYAPVDVIVPVTNSKYEPTEEELKDFTEDERDVTWFDTRRLFRELYFNYPSSEINMLALELNENNKDLALYTLSGPDASGCDLVRMLDQEFEILGVYEWKSAE